MKKRGRVYGYEPNDKPNPTKQEFKHECDVNVIVARFQKTGIAPPAVGIENYLDVSEMTDYKQAVDMLMAAEDDFKKLPMKIKEEVGNTAQGLLDYVADENNKQQLIDWGLLEGEKTSNEPNPEPQVAESPDGT